MKFPLDDEKDVVKVEVERVLDVVVVVNVSRPGPTTPSVSQR